MSSKPCKCEDGTSFSEECCLVSKILGPPKLGKSSPSSDPIKSKLRKVEQASRKLLQKAIDQSTLKNLGPGMLTKATDEIKKQVNRKIENTMDIASIAFELYSDGNGNGDGKSTIEQGLIVQPVYISTNKYTEIDQYQLNAVKETMLVIGLAVIFCLILYLRSEMSANIAKYIIMEKRKYGPHLPLVFRNEIMQYSKKYMWDSFTGVGIMNSFSTVVDQFISFIADDLIAKIPIIGPILSSIVHMVVRVIKDTLQFIIEVASISIELTLFESLIFLLVDVDWIVQHIRDQVIVEIRNPSIIPKSVGLIPNESSSNWFGVDKSLETLLKSQSYSIMYDSFPNDIPLLYFVHEDSLKREVNLQRICSTFQKIQSQTGNLIFTKIISSAPTYLIDIDDPSAYGYYAKLPIWSGVNFMSTNATTSVILSFVLPEQTDMDTYHNKRTLDSLFQLYEKCKMAHLHHKKCDLQQYNPLTKQAEEYFRSHMSKLPFHWNQISRSFNIMMDHMTGLLSKDPSAESAFKVVLKNIIFQTTQPTFWYTPFHGYNSQQEFKLSYVPPKQDDHIKVKLSSNLPAICFPNKVSIDFKLYKALEEAANCISNYVPLLVIYQDDTDDKQFTCMLKKTQFMYIEDADYKGVPIFSKLS